MLARERDAEEARLCGGDVVLMTSWWVLKSEGEVEGKRLCQGLGWWVGEQGVAAGVILHFGNRQ